MPQSRHTKESPVSACVRLMLNLHALSIQDRGNSPEAATACAEMNAYWDLMTQQEQDRVRGLSIDLYTLQDGGPRQVLMTPEERQQSNMAWQAVRLALNRGDYDTILEFLRRPMPPDVPSHDVFYMQAECWQRLGEVKAAIVFMTAAANLDPSVAPHLLSLLRAAGAAEDAEQCANRILTDPNSTPGARYLALVALLAPARSMRPEEARPLVDRLLPELRRALDAERLLPLVSRQSPRTEPALASLLGACYEYTDRAAEAMAVYDETLARMPGDPEILTMRGIAQFNMDNYSAAILEFAKAADREAGSVWPYFFLAHDALEGGRFLECWRQCLAGLERPAPRETHAQLHEWLAICRFLLGQPMEIVLEGFDRAAELEPANPRIRANRAALESHANDRLKAKADIRIPKVRMLDTIRRSDPVDITKSRSNRLAEVFEAAGRAN